tara:strand:+ start:93 stop:476 length:384 start_codon:yes stop_codon:yes gene_type:complete
MKKLLLLIICGLLWFIPATADDNCVDKNPEIILDLGGTTEPEKIIYATYDSCTKQSDYCGVMGCSLDVFDHTGKNTLSYIAKDDWFIRPINIVGQKPTYELIMPLSNGKVRIVKIVNDKLTEIVSDK